MEVNHDSSNLVEIAREVAEDRKKQHTLGSKEGDEPMGSLEEKIDCRLAEVARRRAEASGLDFKEVFDEIHLEYLFIEAKVGGELLREKMEVDRTCEAAIKDLAVVSEEENGEVCGVCQEEFEVGEEVPRTICMHKFHGLCLSKWFCDHKTCPLCRFTILY